jgi:1-acyl-sn-glycerol-3-phosphate acyltransferase
MIAANHVSWLDIFALSAAWPTRFVAKSEIRDWPAAGWIAERAGTLFIRRERKRDIARIHEQIHEVLERGDCVGLFPEGTTSEGDTLLKFHASLFEPAIANGARVHPSRFVMSTRMGGSRPRWLTSASSPSWSRCLACSRNAASSRASPSGSRSIAMA